MDHAAAQKQAHRLMQPALLRQGQLMLRPLALTLIACAVLVGSGTWAERAISPLYLLQLGFPLVAAWFSTGVIIDDVALEMVGATPTPLRLLWLVRVWLILGPVLLLALGWMVALRQGLAVIGYTLVLIVAATGWAHWVARWRRSSMIGNIAIASVLLSQYAVPLSWLPDAGLLWLDSDRWIKQRLFFPIDAHPMYAVLHPQRLSSALVIGGLGCGAWLWCFVKYRRVENLVLPPDE